MRRQNQSYSTTRSGYAPMPGPLDGMPEGSGVTITFPSTMQSQELFERLCLCLLEGPSSMVRCLTPASVPVGVFPRDIEHRRVDLRDMSGRRLDYSALVDQWLVCPEEKVVAAIEPGNVLPLRQMLSKLAFGKISVVIDGIDLDPAWAVMPR